MTLLAAGGAAAAAVGGAGAGSAAAGSAVVGSVGSIVGALAAAVMHVYGAVTGQERHEEAMEIARLQMEAAERTAIAAEQGAAALKQIAELEQLKARELQRIADLLERTVHIAQPLAQVHGRFDDDADISPWTIAAAVEMGWPLDVPEALGRLDDEADVSPGAIATSRGEALAP